VIESKNHQPYSGNFKKAATRKCVPVSWYRPQNPDGEVVYDLTIRVFYVANTENLLIALTEGAQLVKTKPTGHGVFMWLSTRDGGF